MIVRCLNPPHGVLSGGESAIPEPFKQIRRFAEHPGASPELRSVTQTVYCRPQSLLDFRVSDNL
jgi:hypothetical protein